MQCCDLELLIKKKSGNEKEISLKWKKGRERQRKMKSYSEREVRSTAGAVEECEIQSNVTVFKSFYLLGFCVIASHRVGPFLNSTPLSF